jgi:hypothetical protein
MFPVSVWTPYFDLSHRWRYYASLEFLSVHVLALALALALALTHWHSTTRTFSWLVGLYPPE